MDRQFGIRPLLGQRDAGCSGLHCEKYLCAGFSHIGELRRKIGLPGVEHIHINDVKAFFAQILLEVCTHFPGPDRTLGHNGQLIQTHFVLVEVPSKDNHVKGEHVRIDAAHAEEVLGPLVILFHKIHELWRSRPHTKPQLLPVENMLGLGQSDPTEPPACDDIDLVIIDQFLCGINPNFCTGTVICKIQLYFLP